MNEALQAGLDAITESVGGDPSQQLIAAKCRGLLRGYEARWSASEYEITAVEQVVKSDLWNPATDRKSRSFRVAGKIDVQGLYQDRRIIFDHKTTGDEIADAASPFWRQLTVEAQASHYMLLEWMNGRKVDYAIWDVMRKPGISPKGLSKKDLAMVGMGGRYFGATISSSSIEESQHTERETMEMYEARLTHDCTVERPERYFQRRSIPRLDSEIHEYASELWGHSQDLLYAYRENRHPRNSAACMAYSRPCKYLGICSGHDDIESDKWQRKTQVHVELPTLTGDGRDVITNTRIKTFQLCKKKEYYDYGLGLQRQDDEESEALFFGTCWHTGLEAYFESFIEVRKEVDAEVSYAS